jgi:hypothetical protein
MTPQSTQDDRIQAVLLGGFFSANLLKRQGADWLYHFRFRYSLELHKPAAKE